MKELYESGIGMNAPTSDFPYGEVIDSYASGAGTQAGTQIKAKFVDDIVYSLRKMFAKVSSTPNGEAENDLNGYQVLNNMRLFTHYVMNQYDDFDLPSSEQVDTKLPISAANRLLSIYSPTDSKVLKFTASIKDVYDGSILYATFGHSTNVGVTLLGRAVTVSGTFEIGDLVRCHFVDDSTVNIERVFSAAEIQAISTRVGANYDNINNNSQGLVALTNTVSQQNTTLTNKINDDIEAVTVFTPKCVLSITKASGVTTMTDTLYSNIGKDRLLFKVDSVLSGEQTGTYIVKIMSRATSTGAFTECNLGLYKTICSNTAVLIDGTTFNSPVFINNPNSQGGEIRIETGHTGSEPHDLVKFSFSLIIY